MTPYGFMIPGQIVFGLGPAMQAAGLVLARAARVVMVHGCTGFDVNLESDALVMAKQSSSG